MSRQQLEEQSYLTNRSINQGAQARGLGTSGLKNMALLQSQLNQGKGVNQIQTQADNAQRANLMAQMGLQEQLSTQRIGADTTYAANMLQADKEEMAYDERRTGQLLELYQMSLDSGGTADIGALANILGLDLDALPQEQREALEKVSQTDIIGGDRFQQKGAVGLMDVISEARRYSDPSTYLRWAVQNIFTKNKINISDTDGLSNIVQDFIWGDGAFKNNYDLGNGLVRMSTEEATNRVQNMYKGKPFVGNEIEIKADAGGDIRFYVKGTPYDTYNAAVDKINELRTNTQG